MSSAEGLRQDGEASTKGLARSARPHRKWLIPEVVQTSAMDCGPAALRSLLVGHGIDVSYGRLREACQTDVDGTSIDVLETVAGQLGLDAEQVLVPVDHVLRSESNCLPAIAVVLHPDGLTHFVVLWERRGNWVQVMDPAIGRRWMKADALEAILYRHRMPVPEDAWREWAGGADALRTFTARLVALGLARSEVARRLADASADPGWRGLGSLDAATRLVERMVAARALRRGSEAQRALSALVGPNSNAANGLDAARARDDRIPARWWTVRPAEPDADGTPNVEVNGAVLVSVRGVRSKSERAAAREHLPRELAAALDEPREQPLRALTRALLSDGWLGPLALAFTVTAAALLTVLEGLLFRGLVDSDRILTSPEEIWGGWTLAVALVVALAVLEWQNALVSRRIGRHLETRFRAAFHAKVPQLPDRYFKSRPVSDMAERGHMLHVLRAVPALGSQIVHAAAGLAATVIGVVWLDPASAPIIIPGALLALVIPFVAHPALAERDLRRRTYAGSLFRLTLDALLGLSAVRTHTAEHAILREHEGLLADWLRAGESAQRVAVFVEVLQAALGAALALVLVTGHLAREGATGTSLLLTWWALEVPLFAGSLALGVRQYPMLRNALLRMLEPLGAPTDGAAPAPLAGATANEQNPSIALGCLGQGPIAVRLDGVSIIAGGHTILDQVDLAIAPGEHVAVVGPSGAGKSSLVGLLLGWHRAATGQVLIDGVPLDPTLLEQLRLRIAWVDPEVQLWNRSLLDNVRYGASEVALDGRAASLAGVMESADLRSVVEALPDGLQTSLGEGGAFLSGGQGQRVRLARGELRPNVGLVILDEALRGLDRDQRHDLLGRARDRWRDATLICITHDVAETLAFPRVIVIDQGHLVADDTPAALAARPDSLFARLLASERDNRDLLWQNAVWRRVRIESGRLSESPSVPSNGPEQVQP